MEQAEKEQRTRDALACILGSVDAVSQELSAHDIGQLAVHGYDTERKLRAANADSLQEAGLNKATAMMLAKAAGTSTGSSTTVALLKQVLESQQTQAFVSASLLAEHSPYRNDTEPSTSASNVEFKTALIKHYQLSTDRDEHNRLYVTCQATGERLLSGAVVGGHLFPRKAAASGADWGILDPDRDIRNGLVWYDGIEQVWTNHQMCLQEDGLNLVLRVLDKDIMDKSPVDFAAEKNQKHATQHLKDLTFRELDGRAILIPPGVQGPYQRVIVTKAAHAIIEMWKRGKLREDIQPYRLDVMSTFRQKASCLAWVKTTMVHLQHWPVGPEAEEDVEGCGAAMEMAEALAADVEEDAYDDD